MVASAPTRARISSPTVFVGRTQTAANHCHRVPGDLLRRGGLPAQRGLSRLISLEREQIAGLKAFGYSDFAVGLHYAKLVLMIVRSALLGGIVAGIWMGKGMSNIYMDFYSLPFMIYVLKPQVILAAALISIAVAILGTLYAVRSAARLPPAQAMRPEPPAMYHATLVERLGLQRWFSQPTRMILRHIERRR